MAYSAGDRVHVAALGTGVVREVRNRQRYVVELKGRVVVVSAGQLTPAEPQRRRGRSRAGEPLHVAPAGGAPAAATVKELDLHGKTVAEALEALDAFLNEALLAGHPAVHVIHGRSGGRIRGAVHAHLARLPPVRGFRLDPRNAGVTIVQL